MFGAMIGDIVGSKYEFNNIKTKDFPLFSQGCDCDTTGAITGSIAWAYYAVQTGSYTGWVYDRFDPAMLEIKSEAMKYLPQEFIDIANAFHETCWRGMGTYYRVGSCTPILS